MLAQAASLNAMLRFVILTHRVLASRHLALHKATAKLCYVATALLAGVVEQGFCTAPETGEESQAGEGGSFKEAEGMVGNQLLSSCVAVFAAAGHGSVNGVCLKGYCVA